MKEVAQLGNKPKKKTSDRGRKSSDEAKIITIPYPWIFASALLFLTVPLFMFFMGYLRRSEDPRILSGRFCGYGARTVFCFRYGRVYLYDPGSRVQTRHLKRSRQLRLAGNL